MNHTTSVKDKFVKGGTYDQWKITAPHDHNLTLTVELMTTPDGTFTATLVVGSLNVADPRYLAMSGTARAPRPVGGGT